MNGNICAKHDRLGNVTIQFNSQADSILSPDGKLKLLPCETCDTLRWKALNVVSFLCEDCAQQVEQTDSNVEYQAGYAYACGYRD